MAEPEPEQVPPRPPTHVVHNIAQLRAIVAQAEPGTPLLVEIASDMRFGDVSKVWEAVTVKEEGLPELFNPEMIIGKQDAADFFNGKIRQLEELRNDCSGRIGCMNNWVVLKEQELLGHYGPAIPDDYQPIIRFGIPPTLYIDLDQMGTVNADTNRAEVLGDEWFDFPLPPCKHNHDDDVPYWRAAQFRERGRLDRRSLLRFNIEYLKIKIEGLRALREKVSNGIRYLKGQLQWKMFMGCGNEGFASFRDLPLLSSSHIGPVPE